MRPTKQQTLPIEKTEDEATEPNARPPPAVAGARGMSSPAGNAARDPREGAAAADVSADTAVSSSSSTVGHSVSTNGPSSSTSGWDYGYAAYGASTLSDALTVAAKGAAQVLATATAEASDDEEAERMWDAVPTLPAVSTRQTTATTRAEAAGRGGGPSEGGGASALAKVLLAEDSDVEDERLGVYASDDGGGEDDEGGGGSKADRGGAAGPASASASSAADAEAAPGTDFISSMLVSAYEMSENAKREEQRQRRKAVLDELDGWMGAGEGGGGGGGGADDDDDLFAPRATKASNDDANAKPSPTDASKPPPSPRGARSRRDDASTPVRPPRADEGAKGRTLSDAVSFIERRRAEYYARAIGAGKPREVSSGGRAVLENLARAATPPSLAAAEVGGGSVAVAIPLLTPASSLQDVTAVTVKVGRRSRGLTPR